METPEGKAQAQMPQQIQVPMDLDKWVINRGKEDARINDLYQHLVAEVKRVNETNKKLEEEVRKLKSLPPKNDGSNNTKTQKPIEK